MASTVSAMASTSSPNCLGGLSLFSESGRVNSIHVNVGLVRAPFVLRRGSVRCESGDGPVTGLRDAVDKATKRDISRDEILRNQNENESEKKSVFGAKPTSGSMYPRPELERRPETGSRDLSSIFAFDGAAPETINGRLAMVGFVWAVIAEKMNGLTVFEQLYGPGNAGLVYFIAVVQLLSFASVIPMLNGESTDARSFGPFNARAERWIGRTAMLGFLALLLTEQFLHRPIF